MDTLVIELIGTVKNLSPMIWELLMKQVYANVVTQLLWAMIMIVASIIIFKKFIPYAQRMYKKGGAYSTWDMGITFAWMGGGALFITGFIVLTGALQGLYNPEYYAIQNLLSSLH